MRVIRIKAVSKSTIILFLFVLFLSACKKKQIDPTKEPDSSFAYSFDDEGDGSVTFVADSTRGAEEYLWQFGENAIIVSTKHPIIHNVFAGNGKYQISLTYKNKEGELSVTQSITISNKLARSFDDLPTDQRDTIKVLCVVTHESFLKEFEDTRKFPVNSYENKVFVNFMERTLPNRPKELNRLVFEKIVYKLSAQEMNRFNEAGDPIAFLNYLFTQSEDALFKNILNRKRTEAATKIAFFLKDPAPGGISKYGIGGYAVYEGSYFVLLSAGSYVHELGHVFGLDHDKIRNCSYVPIMNGVGTQTSESCNSVWNELPEFQVQGTVTNLALLRAPNYYDYAVPLVYRDQFPTGTLLRTIDITHIATTPYYREGIDMSKTIANALIDQYNIRQKPALVNRLDTNPDKPNPIPGQNVRRLREQRVSCPILK